MAYATDRRPGLRRSTATFTDREGRTIAVRPYRSGLASLVEMYDHFDDESRAQGLPPREESRCREWLLDLLDEGLNVVAWHGEEAVGHAVLMPHDDTAELAIFVRPAYQAAGIGTRLIRCLLGHGRQHGVAHVWLTVSRTNRIAMNLYRSAGFEITERDRGEYEMERPL